MLQIRLSKLPAGDGAAATVRPPPPPEETVTVACPDHLVIADLPVAKSIGAVTMPSSTAVRSVGRRSRRQLGQRVHLCVSCDFPIAIYGRLIPCEHVFCLACARSDSSCYLCDERIQKIQTIKMMEGIFICAAPHCLKSFLKKSEFEAHIHETHADLLQRNTEKDGGGNEADALAHNTRPPSMEPQKHAVPQQESSTARAPLRSPFSPGSSSQAMDHNDDRSRHHHHPRTDQPMPNPLLQLQPPLPFQLPLQQQQPGRNPSQTWLPQVPVFQNPIQSTPDKPQSGALLGPTFPAFPLSFPGQQPSLPAPTGNANQPQIPALPPFGFPPLPGDGGTPLYYGATYEMPRQDLALDVGGSDRGSVLGMPPLQQRVEGFPLGMGYLGVPHELSGGSGNVSLAIPLPPPQLPLAGLPLPPPPLPPTPPAAPVCYGEFSRTRKCEPRWLSMG